MGQTVDYGAYIIDLTDAMLEHGQGLTDAQIQRLQMINRRAVDFVTLYMRNEDGSAPDLLNFLSHDAQTPLRIIMGCSQMLLSGQCGPLRPVYAEAVDEIYECVCSMIADVQQMRMDLQTFMEAIGIME